MRRTRTARHGGESGQRCGRGASCLPVETAAVVRVASGPRSSLHQRRGAGTQGGQRGSEPRGEALPGGEGAWPWRDGVPSSGLWCRQGGSARSGTTTGGRSWCASTGCGGCARRATSAGSCTSTTPPGCPRATSTPSSVSAPPGLPPFYPEGGRGRDPSPTPTPKGGLASPRGQTGPAPALMPGPLQRPGESGAGPGPAPDPRTRSQPSSGTHCLPPRVRLESKAELFLSPVLANHTQTGRLERSPKRATSQSWGWGRGGRGRRFRNSRHAGASSAMLAVLTKPPGP